LRKKYVPDGLTVTAIVTFLAKGAPKLTLNVISEAKASCSHLLELLVLHESADSADAILQLLEKTQTVAKYLNNLMCTLPTKSLLKKKYISLLIGAYLTSAMLVEFDVFLF
jgi:hypothetical protein